MNENEVPKPSTLPELVRAWKVSGRRAQVLESRLQRAVQLARRYRRDLLRLAEQNRSRRFQAESLQQKLLELLEQRHPPAPLLQVEEIGADQETISAEHYRQLLIRLRQAQELVGEFETLLEFREKQVHQLSAAQADSSPGAADWRVQTLQKELTEARHRIRLLTRELAGAQSNHLDRVSEFTREVAQSNPMRVSELELQVSQLEQRLLEAGSQGGAELQDRLNRSEQKAVFLHEQLSSRLEELKKAAATIQAARERIRQLESELAKARSQESAEGFGELAEGLGDITRLQDEVARLQDENERLLLRSGSGNSEREAKLEAAVVELRQKLQLAGSQFQKVRSALTDKHEELTQWQQRAQELEKHNQVIQQGGRALEAALGESRSRGEALKAQLEELRHRPGGDSSEAMASLEAKLKEARRNTLRAQSEAGQKRREMSQLQKENQELKARLAALGG